MIFKARSNPLVYVLACQIVMLALRESHDWPESIAKVRDCVTVHVMWSHDMVVMTTRDPT